MNHRRISTSSQRCVFVVEPVKKAVIPAAGLGTRLLPLTRFIPKELLPVGAKPILQHIMEMYLASGVSEFAIITSPQKPLLRDFVEGNWKQASLPYKPDRRFYHRLKDCRIVFFEQPEPRGVADAVALTRNFVGKAPFACIMPDCLLFSEKPFLGQLLQAFSRHGKNTIGAVTIHAENAHEWGNVGLLQVDPLDEGCFCVTSLSNKTAEPLVAERGRTITKGFGGGIYLPVYFDLVERTRPRGPGEVDDVPIHHILMQRSELVGVLLQGEAFDAGHPSGFRSALRFSGRPAGRQSSTGRSSAETEKGDGP